MIWLVFKAAIVLSYLEIVIIIIYKVLFLISYIAMTSPKSTY